jgi:hypothetical protein
MRDPAGTAAADQVNRRLVADRPDALWVSDVTQHSTEQGWVYCAVVLGRIRRVGQTRLAGWLRNRNVRDKYRSTQRAAAPVLPQAHRPTRARRARTRTGRPRTQPTAPPRPRRPHTRRDHARLPNDIHSPLIRDHHWKPPTQASRVGRPHPMQIPPGLVCARATCRPPHLYSLRAYGITLTPIRRGHGRSDHSHGTERPDLDLSVGPGEGAGRDRTSRWR